jgi:hypothetical protein
MKLYVKKITSVTPDKYHYVLFNNAIKEYHYYIFNCIRSKYYSKGSVKNFIDWLETEI